MTRIIVVEDDPGQLEELVFILNHAGYEAQGAVNAKALDQYLEGTRPDIALLDYNLPDGTGAELAARLREKFGQGIGIVMVTARGQGADRVECRNAGVNDYLVKPVDFNELLAVVKNLLVYIKPEIQSAQDAWQLWTDKLMVVPIGAEGVAITAQESVVLKAFAEAPKQLLSRDEMIRVLGHTAQAYDMSALEMTISRLRKKLPLLPDGRSPVQSVRSFGYKFLQQLIIKS